MLRQRKHFALSFASILEGDTMPQLAAGADRNSNLKSCFRHCCQHGKAHIIGAGSMINVSLESLRVSSRQFIRFCRELEIVQPVGQIEPMTVDIIFAQCKVPGDRSINFKASGFRPLATNMRSRCLTA